VYLQTSLSPFIERQADARAPRRDKGLAGSLREGSEHESSPQASAVFQVSPKQGRTFYGHLVRRTAQEPLEDGSGKGMGVHSLIARFSLLL